MLLTTRISKFHGALNARFSAGNLTPCMTAVVKGLSDACPCELSLPYLARPEGRRWTSPKGGNRGSVLMRVSEGDALSGFERSR
jgi:hypothetical protein